MHFNHIDILRLSKVYSPFYILPAIRTGKVETCGRYIDILWMRYMITIYQKKRKQMDSPLDNPLKVATALLLIASPFLFLFWLFLTTITGILRASAAVAAMAAVIFLTVLACIMAAKVIFHITDPDSKEKTNETPDSKDNNKNSNQCANCHSHYNSTSRR